MLKNKVGFTLFSGVILTIKIII